MAKEIPDDAICWRPGCKRKAKVIIKWDFKDKFACLGHKGDDGMHWVWDPVIFRKVPCVCKKGPHKNVHVTKRKR